MILTVSDFLDRLREKEHQQLKKQNITHPPTIGDMYEGLTQDIIDRAFPPSSEIDVVAGFISDASGNLSDELDCMVVSGPGEVVPYTDKKKFIIDDVVAVIQVKKNLYSKDLKSGYENLASVTKFKATRNKRVSLLQDAFQGITRRTFPENSELDSLPWEIQMIYHTLLMELVNPARIILGYGGFKTLSSLRKSYVKFLTNQNVDGPAKGYGISNFPSLICCGKHCLVKSNGMPFTTPIEQDGYWPAFGSVTANPLELLLQIIWTKLVYDRKMPSSIFDEDKYLQPMMRFIDTIPAKSGEVKGWMYRVDNTPDKIVNEPTPKPETWEPIFLDNTQFIIVNQLCMEDEIDVTETKFSEFLLKEGYTVDVFVKSLNQVGLATLNNNNLVLLTKSCQCVILPDGRFAAAENCSGQLTRWVSDFMKSRNTQPEAGENASRPTA